MNLIDLISGNTGNEVAERAENKFGISKTQVIGLLAVAAPLIISYLKKKSEDKNEAEALNNALEKDHDGSILDNLSLAEERENEGGSILGHIFGNDKPKIENQLSESTGISMDKIAPLLSMLAPVIMGYIGKEKRQNNVNSGGIGDLLGNILGGATNQSSSSNNPLNDIIGSVLGGGNQSSDNPLGDILGNVLGGDKKEQGGLGSILGSFLGK
ncbi:MAG: hypothetical protein CSA38_03500 [Flavobacteriales bacterium]|nr:MAG: hypothetical protein CSA38_03500 [Flavobacteriales bacterium]